MKKRKISLTAGYFFKQELLLSKAYTDLPKSARDLLHCFVFELKYSKGRGKKYVYYNNGEVSYTEIQFKEEFGRASNTYLTARNQLIKNGLIRQTYRGGMCRGDMATYKILITSDLLFCCSCFEILFLFFESSAQIPVLLSNEQLANKRNIKKKTKYFISLFICNKS